jgi:hypothetical protein
MYNWVHYIATIFQVKRCPVPYQKKPREPSAVQAGERVKWLLTHVWGGNQAAMSQEVGCSRTAIYKIVTGRQPPGRRLLSAIAAHPKINPGWVLAGEGEPLLAERQQGFTGGWLLPVYKSLPSGLPQEHQNLQTGQWFPVQGGFHAPSRFWYEIQAGDPITQAALERIAVGDLLLMDSDPVSWIDIVALDDRLCAVWVSDHESDERHLMLGRAEYHPGDSEERQHLLANTFDWPLPNRKVQAAFVMSKTRDGQPMMRKIFVVEDSKTGACRKTSRMALTPHSREIRLVDVVAVCVLVLRRCYPNR